MGHKDKSKTTIKDYARRNSKEAGRSSHDGKIAKFLMFVGMVSYAYFTQKREKRNMSTIVLRQNT